MGARYWRCSVSTCNSGRVKLYFCSVACWDAHLPTARHRSAFAIEEITSIFEDATGVDTADVMKRWLGPQDQAGGRK